MTINTSKITAILINLFLLFFLSGCSVCEKHFSKHEHYYADLEQHPAISINTNANHAPIDNKFDIPEINNNKSSNKIIQNVLPPDY